MVDPYAAQGAYDPAAGATPLEALIAQTRQCCLRPFRFFVSWQGVLTLAYTGFPPALMQLKRNIDATCPALKAENSGSRWPKTTLAALRDRARLTPQQLQRLNTICLEESAAAFASRDDPDLRIWLGHAAIVVYACRSLERVLSHRSVAFANTHLDHAEPLPVDHQRVLTIVAEADDDDYWFAASRDGNRETHYRGPHVGATLLHWPETFRGVSVRPELANLVGRFRARVERELPSLYVWFANESLHVTLRALES